jgi:hypothetical protein
MAPMALFAVCGRKRIQLTMDLAPIALFTYNRLWHTQQTIAALQNNGLATASDLFIFSDGHKSEAEREQVQSVREYLNTITGFKNVSIIEQQKNLGLAQSIITGVTDIVQKYGRIIVVEDDIVTSPYFLRYMNDALEFYQDEEKVISIHGYVYPFKSQLPDSFFLKGADCWGWATWRRGWNLFEPDGQKLLKELRERGLTDRFDFHGAYPYTKTLEEQINGENDSWAIRWYASAFLEGKLTLYPGKSLAKNIGNDNSGTHCNTSDAFDTEVSREPVRIAPVALEENQVAWKAFGDFFLSLKPTLLQRVRNRMDRMMMNLRR